MSYSDCFAGVYDEFTGNADYEKRADFILNILRNNGIKDGILLDLACGTGTLTDHYIKAGYDVIAVDNSEDMLARAMGKLGDRGRSVLFLCQDMRKLDLYGTVRATVCSLDGINHLLTENDVLEAFNKVSLFTEPGGVFVFDVNTVYKHKNILASNAFVYENESGFLVWRNYYDSSSETVEMILDIFKKNNSGLYKRSCDSITERAYPAEKINELLLKAGFSAVSIYADMSFSPPGEDAQRIYFVAVK